MGFLAGKRILITGLLSNRSIAYGIASACKREGAELAFTYVGERFKDRITDFAKEFGSDMIYECDVGSDEQIAALFSDLGQRWEKFDGLVHSIGFAPREAIAGDFLEGLSREGFKIAHDISAYSFPALAKAALPLLSDKASLVTLTYLGSERVVPNYNTMGLAKASLEASVRYLASSVGPRGIRANGISAGPIKTLAASGIKGFGKLLGHFENVAPMRRNVTVDEVGNVAAFLLSDLSSGAARVWNYGADVSVPIFTAGAIAGQVQSAEAAQREALAQYRQAVQTGFRETEDALAGITGSRAARDAAQAQSDALADYARLARRRYEGGYTSYLEVLDAERSLFSAQLELSQAQAEVLIQSTLLYKSLGGGWLDIADRQAPQPLAAQ